LETTTNKTIYKYENGLPNSGSDGLNLAPTKEKLEFLKIKVNTLKITADTPDFIWQIIAELQKHFFVVVTSRLIHIGDTYLLYSQIFAKEGNAPQKQKSFDLELNQ
jgi:hypothetical protein